MESCKVDPVRAGLEDNSMDAVTVTQTQSLKCEQPHLQSARMVTRTYVFSMFPFIVGAVVAFSYASVMRIVEGEWSLNPIAFALDVHPRRVLSRTFDLAILLHVIAAFIWVGAAIFQLTSAYYFAEKDGWWRKAHGIVGRNVAITSMCLFLPTAIFAIILQEKAPGVSLARYLVFDLSTNLLQATQIVANAFVGIHKARKKDFFAHKQLMFYSAMASLRAGADRWGMALVQLTMPHQWLGDITFTLGSVIGTLAVLIAAICVAYRLNALTTRVSLINMSILVIFIVLDLVGALDALGVFG